MPTKKEIEFVTMQAFRPFARKVDDLHRWAFNGTSEKLEKLESLIEPLNDHILEAKFLGKYGQKLMYILVSLASIAVGVDAVKKVFF